MTLPIEPLFFTPCFIEKPWGGHTLHTIFNKEISSESPIGESWELSGFGHNQTCIAHGPLKSQTLGTIFQTYRSELVGNRNSHLQTFPLLIKFIDAQYPLSVQVHPDDRTAQNKFGEPFGKTECWFIAHAGPEARLCTGFRKNLTRPELHAALSSGNLEPLLNIFPVTEGELYFIPAGTVHAIMGDVVIYEVQQSSDTTLRLYDWKRTDADGNQRTLHIDDAVAIANTTDAKQHLIQPVHLEDTPIYTRSLRVACPYFAIEEFLWKHSGIIPLQQRHTFRIITMFKGDGEIVWNDEAVPVPNGTTVLIPAELSHCSIAATENAHCLLIYIPDISSDIIHPLLQAGINASTIAALGDIPGFYT